ncbi:hypothetical protein MRB53_017065 [Persea americana]|uniref:Uncharacterized protein n=1 Tax=Persea americana TaxID=3435 RepID=A0ACC2M4W2_PERAE|nr:hypothetical protein MRB53_017065 [Persea americana]
MNTKFGRRLSNHTYKLHKQFRELKDAKGEEYARNHPPKDVGPTKWIDLIDKKWNTTKFLKQSKANIANREKMKTKHRCGSRSIPVRVEKLAREKKMLPDLAEFYRETHYNEETHEWISFEAQANYENMIQTQADHLSQPGSIPLTAEELSIKVLKPKSGYVKGLGMRPSSSIRRTTTISAETNDYVKRLEMEIETQREQIQMQNNKIEELEEVKDSLDTLGMGGTHPRVDILLDWIGVAFLTCNNDLICLNVHFCLIRIHILWSCTRPQTLLQFTELSLPLPQCYVDFCNYRPILTFVTTEFSLTPSPWPFCWKLKQLCCRL